MAFCYDCLRLEVALDALAANTVDFSHLEMQDDFVAVVCREELLHVCTGVTAQGIKPAI